MAYLPFVSADRQTVLGHYGVAQVSGSIAATPTALDVHGSVRWAPTLANTYFVLLKLRLGWSVISAVTTAVRMTYQASIARGFTVDFTTAATAISLSAKPKTNAMRGTMGNSLMGVSGPRICTTTTQSGQTYTLDAAPFAICTWPALLAVTATGTAVAQPAGMAGQMATLYERNGDGMHPPVLSNNEGIAIELTHTGIATGTYSLFTEWTWAEVLVF